MLCNIEGTGCSACLHPSQASIHITHHTGMETSYVRVQPPRTHLHSYVRNWQHTNRGIIKRFEKNHLVDNNPTRFPDTQQYGKTLVSQLSHATIANMEVHNLRGITRPAQKHNLLGAALSERNPTTGKESHTPFDCTCFEMCHTI